MGRIFRKVSKVICATAAGVLLYSGGLILFERHCSKNSPRIESQEQLEKVLKAEIMKYHKPIKIRIRLLSRNECISYKFRDKTYGDYGIEIGGSLANEFVLKHELCHILNGHCDGMEKIENKTYRFLKQFFWYEPKATIHAVID